MILLIYFWFLIFKLILQLQGVNLAIPDIVTQLITWNVINGKNFNCTSNYSLLLDLFGYLELSWVILGCCVMFTLLQWNWRRSVCWSSWCLGQQLHYLQFRAFSSDTFSLVSWYSTISVVILSKKTVKSSNDSETLEHIWCTPGTRFAFSGVSLRNYFRHTKVLWIETALSNWKWLRNSLQNALLLQIKC